MNDNLSLFSHSKISRILFFIILGTILISFFFRMTALYYRYFNEDELEHLHVGYLIYSGQVPYVDFFEHHLPMFHYIMSPFFKYIESAKEFIFFMRWSMFLIVIFIFLLTFKIAATIFDKETGWLSLFFLSSNLLFFEKSLEIRPDVPQTLFWLISLYFIIEGLRRERYLFYIGSGLLLGFAFTFTQKTVYLLPPLFVTFFIWIILGSFGKNCFRRIKFFMVFSISFFFPILVLFAYFYFIGAFEEFFRWNFVIATLWQREIYPWEYMLRTMRQNSPFWIFGLGYIVVYFLKKIPKWDKSPETLIMPLSVFFLFVAMLLTSGPYRQTYLPILPVVAIFSGRCLSLGIATLKEVTNREAILIPCILIFFSALSLPPIVETAGETEVGNHRQLNIIDFVHRITNPNDSVFDGWGYAFKRPPAFYYHMLSVGVVNMMGKDSREKKIIKSIKDNNTKAMIYDYRVRKYLPESVQYFLKANFISINYLDVRVVGRILDHDLIESSRGSFELISDAYYRINVTGSNNKVFLDGRAIDEGKSFFLKKGHHNISVLGFYDEVVIKFDWKRTFLLNLP